MAKSKSYYSLLTSHDDDGVWNIQFGDYDRDVVKDELENEWKGVPKVRTKIICTGDSQAEIEAAVAKLNGRTQQ